MLLAGSPDGAPVLSALDPLRYVATFSLSGPHNYGSSIRRHTSNLLANFIWKSGKRAKTGMVLPLIVMTIVGRRRGLLLRACARRAVSARRDMCCLASRGSQTRGGGPRRGHEKVWRCCNRSPALRANDGEKFEFCPAVTFF